MTSINHKRYYRDIVLLMREIVIIAHNLRSSHNVGSLLRTADGLGVNKVYLTGYTPYPTSDDDLRLPHLAKKVHQQIAKTALGAEERKMWEHSETIEPVIVKLHSKGYTVCALEQTPKAVKLPNFRPPEKTAIIVGREVEGIEPEVLALAKVHLEIPMFGLKESYNVVEAATMAIYHLRFFQ